MKNIAEQLEQAGKKKTGVDAERKLTLEILRMKRVMEITGKGRTSIYEAMAAGKFPPKVRIGARSIGFYSTDIEAWLADPMGYHAPEAV